MQKLLALTSACRKQKWSLVCRCSLQILRTWTRLDRGMLTCSKWLHNTFPPSCITVSFCLRRFPPATVNVPDSVGFCLRVASFIVLSHLRLQLWILLFVPFLISLVAHTICSSSSSSIPTLDSQVSQEWFTQNCFLALSYAFYSSFSSGDPLAQLTGDWYSLDRHVQPSLDLDRAFDYFLETLGMWSGSVRLPHLYSGAQTATCSLQDNSIPWPRLLCGRLPHLVLWAPNTHVFV